MVRKSNSRLQGDPGTPRARRRDRQRDAILRAAAQLFRERGFAETGMRDIAEAADLSAANLYHYFDGKHDLLFYCQDRALDRMLAAVTAARRSPVPAPERLRAVLTATNPELGEEALRKRVDRVFEYVSPEAGRERAAAWVADDPSEYAIALGDRLSIVHGAVEPLFEGALAARVAELYPEARIEQVDGGPISNPGAIADLIRSAR